MTWASNGTPGAPLPPLKRKPFVYMAGPFSSAPGANTREMMRNCLRLIEGDKVTPFCPHLTLLMEVALDIDYQQFLDYDLEVIASCDALIRYPGESSGADGEVEYALARGIPVFDNEDDLNEWAERWFCD